VKVKRLSFTCCVKSIIVYGLSFQKCISYLALKISWEKCRSVAKCFMHEALPGLNYTHTRPKNKIPEFERTMHLSWFHNLLTSSYGMGRQNCPGNSRSQTIQFHFKIVKNIMGRKKQKKWHCSTNKTILMTNQELQAQWFTEIKQTYSI
jgi:hypothetical protein